MTLCEIAEMRASMKKTKGCGDRGPYHISVQLASLVSA